MGWTGGTISLRNELTQEVVRKHQSDWVSEIEEFRRRILAIAPDIQNSLPARGDSLDAIEACANAAKEELDVDADADQVLPSVRLDAFLRVRALILLRRIRKKEPYNSRARINDSFDLELLKYLAFPTALCTSDGPLLAAVEITKAWQRSWMVRPEELSNVDIIERLSKLEWPWFA